MLLSLIVSIKDSVMNNRLVPFQLLRRWRPLLVLVILAFHCEYNFILVISFFHVLSSVLPLVLDPSRRFPLSRRLETSYFTFSTLPSVWILATWVPPRGTWESFLIFFLFLAYYFTFRSTIMDSTGLNSTECGFDVTSDDFWHGNSDRHRGRLPSQMSSSGIGSGPIKHVNNIFTSKDEWIFCLFHCL